MLCAHLCFLLPAALLAVPSFRPTRTAALQPPPITPGCLCFLAGARPAPAADTRQGSQGTSDSEGEVFCDTMEQMEPEQVTAPRAGRPGGALGPSSPPAYRRCCTAVGSSPLSWERCETPELLHCGAAAGRGGRRAHGRSCCGSALASWAGGGARGSQGRSSPSRRLGSCWLSGGWSQRVPRPGAWLGGQSGVKAEDGRGAAVPTSRPGALTEVGAARLPLLPARLGCLG